MCNKRKKHHLHQYVSIMCNKCKGIQRISMQNLRDVPATEAVPESFLQTTRQYVLSAAKAQWWGYATFAQTCHLTIVLIGFDYITVLGVNRLYTHTANITVCASPKERRCKKMFFRSAVSTIWVRLPVICHDNPQVHNSLRAGHREQASATPHFQASHTEDRCSHGCELSLTNSLKMSWTLTETTTADAWKRSSNSKERCPAKCRKSPFQSISNDIMLPFPKFSHLSAWSNRPRSKLLSARPASITWCSQKNISPSKDIVYMIIYSSTYSIFIYIFYTHIYIIGSCCTSSICEFLPPECPNCIDTLWIPLVMTVT